MALEYFYITNSPEYAKACERAGVDRIFIDMEYIGNLYQDFGTIYATVLNKDIQKKFKINFIYQQ